VQVHVLGSIVFVSMGVFNHFKRMQATLKVIYFFNFLFPKVIFFLRGYKKRPVGRAASNPHQIL